MADQANVGQGNDPLLSLLSGPTARDERCIPDGHRHHGKRH
jgi:hypothetical protein